MTVAALADIVELLHAPVAGSLADRRPDLRAALRGVQDLVIGHHDNPLGMFQPVDADLVQLVLAGQDERIVNNDQVGVRKTKSPGLTVSLPLARAIIFSTAVIPIQANLPGRTADIVVTRLIRPPVGCTRTR